MIGSLGAEARSVVALAALLVRGAIGRDDRVSVHRRAQRHRQFWIDAARLVDLPTRRVGNAGLEITLHRGSPEEQVGIEMSDTGHALTGAPEDDESDDGMSVYDVLDRGDVPVVRRRPFTIATMSAAARFLDGAPGLCVVQAVERSVIDQGVGFDVGDARTLRVAAAAAAAAAVAHEVRGVHGRSRPWPGRLAAGLRDLSHVPLVIRHQVQGEVYRLLFLDGALLDVVQRAASTTASDESCLPAGHLISPRTVEVGARAAAVVRDRLVGVDVVIESGLDDAGGRVLEIDTVPKLDVHYHGKPGAVDVARIVLERLARQ